ncbi:TetR/AcrR family transcriptional regulator [Paenibacillus donghaensis]|uniref:HTH tetR-type domain-containing protein n=1 Tax=Paenibacillus donghaensis TaxID=414771 RepID=A0A2Z2KQL6_9BACL|nr:TetR/AcrR family transcriptional regulator [Paenibacillus donghaensis]ASA21178.1 hypothetical protein B9T62_10495 [Paenibacillus donghaensis]
MPAEHAKEQILGATIHLLNQEGNTSNITARKIAAEAHVNLAMINYYFGSKDALIHSAVDTIINERAQELKQADPPDASARDKLKNFLTQLSDLTLKYTKLTKASIPYVLLQGDIDLPHYILPFIREHYRESRSETECRIIAYQLISFCQLAFYRSTDFMRYLSLDVSDKLQRDDMLDTLLKLHLPFDEKEGNEEGGRQ